MFVTVRHDLMIDLDVTSPAERLQQVLGQRESHEQKKHETLLSTVTQTLERTIGNKLERIVRAEVRNQIAPSTSSLHASPPSHNASPAAGRPQLATSCII